MNPGPFSCTQCQASLPGPDLYNTAEAVNCPSCNVPLRLRVFPAFVRDQPAARTGDTVLIEGESTCFYHSGKKAVLPCESCGRFLCSLCDLEVSGRHICPSCLERGLEKGKLADLESSRTRYDQLALWLALLPILFWPVTLFTAPAAIYLVVRHWNSPTHYLKPGRSRLVLALMLALLQVAGWALLIFTLLTR